MDLDWQADLDRWLAPFVAALRHKTRARMLSEDWRHRNRPGAGWALHISSIQHTQSDRNRVG